MSTACEVVDVREDAPCSISSVTSRQALVELEATTDIRQILRDVFFLGAREVDAAGKKAICIYVPVPQQQQFQKIQVRHILTAN